MRRTALMMLAILALVWLIAAVSQAPASARAASASGAPEGVWVWVDIHRKSLTVYRGDEALAQYPIATGAYATPTPIGVYRVNSRFAGEMSGFGTCFLGLNVPWGQYGLHGTNKPGSIGSNASHGCVRMRVKDAEAVYKLVPNGARVVMEGGPYGQLDTTLRTLRAGDRNSHVAAVQSRLRQLGYYAGSSDGVFGQGTIAAVRKARKALRLPESDTVDHALYRALGLILFE